VVGYGTLPYSEGLLAEAFDLAAKSIAEAYPVTASLAMVTAWTQPVGS